MSMGLSMLATVLGMLLAAGILDAAPYQELQPRAGYVPVYIREGETPLSDINPRLAEAFNEMNYKNLPFDGSNSGIIQESSDEPNSSNSNEELVDTPPEVAGDLINSSSEENNKKINEANEPNANVVEAAKEAIKELVSVFETDMLEKLGLSDDAEQPKSQDIITSEIENKPEEISIENQKTERDENKISKNVDDKLSEKTSDVLTVEAFKAKDFNKESIKDDEIDIPEEVPSVQ